MKKVYVKFETLEQINHFVNIVSKSTAPCELSTDQRSVNAKSIMGILTLGLAEPLMFQCQEEHILELIASYICV